MNLESLASSEGAIRHSRSDVAARAFARSIAPERTAEDRSASRRVRGPRARTGAGHSAAKPTNVPVSPTAPSLWAPTLESARDGDAAARARVSRYVSERLRAEGGGQIREDWADEIEQITGRLLDRWSRHEGPVREHSLRRFVKSQLWTYVLDGVCDDDLRATAYLSRTLRRLVASFDRARRIEAHWDDIVQDVSIQVYSLWREPAARTLRDPWAFLGTVAKRRYVDTIRKQKPTVDIESTELEAAGSESEGFVRSALAHLEGLQMRVVFAMDIEGRTRREVARSEAITAGAVNSARRAAHRTLYRWLGEALPPELRRVWFEMFKGGRRPSRSEVAHSLGLTESQVSDRLARARASLGLFGERADARMPLQSVAAVRQ